MNIQFCDSESVENCFLAHYSSYHNFNRPQTGIRYSQMVDIYSLDIVTTTLRQSDA